MSIEQYHPDLSKFEFKLPSREDEEKLLRAARRGDAEAVDTLVRRYQLYLVTLANRFGGRFMQGHMAPDIMSVANGALMEALNTYKRQPLSRFKTWVFVWVRRRVLEFLAKEMRYTDPKGNGDGNLGGDFVYNESSSAGMRPSSGIFSNVLLSVEPTFHQIQDRGGLGPADIEYGIKELSVRVMECVRRLSARHQRLIRMRFFRRMTFDQIAARQHPPVCRTTAATRVHAAVSRLRRVLGEIA